MSQVLNLRSWMEEVFSVPQSSMIDPNQNHLIPMSGKGILYMKRLSIFINFRSFPQTWKRQWKHFKLPVVQVPHKAVVEVSHTFHRYETYRRVWLLWFKDDRGNWWTERWLRLCLSVSLSPLYLCIYLSTYLPTNLSIHLSIYPSIHPSIRLSIHPSIHPSI